MIGGRAIWDFAKKQAKIAVRHGSEMMMGSVERPTRNGLMTVVTRNVTPVRTEDFALTPCAFLSRSFSVRGCRRARRLRNASAVRLISIRLSAPTVCRIAGPGPARYMTPCLGDRSLVLVADPGNRRLLFRHFRCPARARQHSQDALSPGARRCPEQGERRRERGAIRRARPGGHREIIDGDAVDRDRANATPVQRMRQVKRAW